MPLISFSDLYLIYPYPIIPSLLKSHKASCSDIHQCSGGSCEPYFVGAGGCLCAACTVLCWLARHCFDGSSGHTRSSAQLSSCWQGRHHPRSIWQADNAGLILMSTISHSSISLISDFLVTILLPLLPQFHSHLHSIYRWCTHIQSPFSLCFLPKCSSNSLAWSKKQEWPNTLSSSSAYKWSLSSQVFTEKAFSFAVWS